MQPAEPGPVAPLSSSATSAAPDCPRAAALEPEAIAAEVACLLSAYVRINTVNPPGNELAAAQFVAAVLARDGIESQIIESAPGRANLIARLRGRGPGRAVGLMHHMDVVPATAAEWTVPPFEGALKDGLVWGRGSVDNKGGGVLQVMTLLLAKRLGTPLERDLVLIATADEEAGGGYGARYLTEKRAELFQDLEYVLTEGGAIVEVGEGRFVYSVELAQKAPLWLRLTAHGRSGHGSAPSPETAVNALVRALARLSAYRFPIAVLPEVQTLYALKAAAMPEPLRAAYGDLRGSLQKPAFRDEFLKEPRDAALVQNTIAITVLKGSDKENVIPGEASAVLDIRLLPGQDVDGVVGEVKRVLDEPGIEVTQLLSWKSHASPKDTSLFRSIEALAGERHPGAAVVPNVIGGFTDCNAFRAHDITCYGFLPVRFQPSDFERIHGKDERASVADLAAGVRDLHALLAKLGAN